MWRLAKQTALERIFAFVTLGRKNDLQGTWKQGEKQLGRELDFLSPPQCWKSCHCFVSIFMDNQQQPSFVLQMWFETHFSLHLILNKLHLSGGGGGGVVHNVSRDRWYVFLSICCSALPLCLFFLLCKRCSINCWHWLCLVKSRLLKPQEI